MTGINCDRCGRFTNPDAPGVSFSRMWWNDGYGGELLDPDFRCSPCTDKHGIGYTNCAPTFPGNGRNPLPTSSEPDPGSEAVHEGPVHADQTSLTNKRKK